MNGAIHKDTEDIGNDDIIMLVIFKRYGMTRFETFSCFWVHRMTRFVAPYCILALLVIIYFYKITGGYKMSDIKDFTMNLCSLINETDKLDIATLIIDDLEVKDRLLIELESGEKYEIQARTTDRKF